MRTVELVRALQLIHDAIGRVRQGEVRYLAAMAGQLRALLTERTRTADPLLLHLASVLKQELNVYCMPDVNDPEFPPSLKDALLLHIAGFPVTANRQLAAQVPLAIEDLLARDIIFFRDRKYTVRTIIEWFANKAGGAHYSRQLPEDFASLLTMSPFGQMAPIANALLQVGEATATAGRQLLKSVVDFEIHTLIAVPQQDPKGLADLNVLFDARYEGTTMRLTLALDRQLKPVFVAQGLQGVAATVRADRLADWREAHHLHAACCIQEDFATRFELAVDGQVVGRVFVPEPLFVLADPLDYESYHNRSVDGAPQNFSFAVGHVLMLNSDIDLMTRARVMLFMNEKRQNPEQAMILYGPNSFGHSPRGTKDLELTGSYRREKAADVLVQPGSA